MSTFPEHIFRAYDIRGIALPEAGQPVEIDPAFAEILGQAIGYYFRSELGVARPQLAVGHDVRLTAKELESAFVAGLVSAGVRVARLGLSSSPYAYFSVCAGSLDGGVVITASHNPKEYNGFKVMAEKASPIAGDELQKIGKIAKSIAAGELIIAAEQPGESLEVSFLDEYTALIGDFAAANRPLKIVVDAGNGAAGPFAPAMLRSLGHEVFELFCEPDGNFPNHAANPEEHETLHDLAAKVLEVGADLGLAFDGDGDRVGVLDAAGQLVSPDFLLVVLARDFLSRNPGAEVICEQHFSGAVTAEIEKAGGKPVLWRNGHSFLKQKMKETGAMLAGETSGHFFFGENWPGFDDGLAAAARIAQIVANTGRSIAELTADIPVFSATPKILLPVSDSEKFDKVAAMVAAATAKFDQTLTLDGVRVTYPDGAWFVIRASNTTPMLTSRAEAPNSARLAAVVADLAELIESVGVSAEPLRQLAIR